MKHNPGHLGGYLHPRSAATRTLVNCAFCFCWDAWFHDHPALHQTATPRPQPGRGERRAARRPAAVGTVLAPGNPGGASLAYPLGNASALVADMVQCAPAAALQAPINSVAAGCGLHLYIHTNKLPLARGHRLEPVSRDTAAVHSE